MTKEFKFHNAAMSIEYRGHGSYVLNGLGQSMHFTDSSVWDECDNDEDYNRCLDARRTSYNRLRSNR